MADCITGSQSESPVIKDVKGCILVYKIQTELPFFIYYQNAIHDWTDNVC